MLVIVNIDINAKDKEKNLSSLKSFIIIIKKIADKLI